MAGYSVTTFSDSPRALKAFREDPQAFDLVITDLTMPELTGDKLAKAIHSLHPELPIILYSGFNSRFSRENASSLGIHCFLQKPINMNELLSNVRATLKNAGDPVMTRQDLQDY